MDDEEDLNEADENVLLRYCFVDIYGPNFGFRTLIEVAEVCEEGRICDKLGRIEGCENDTDILSEDNLSPIEGERRIFSPKIKVY